MADIDTNLPTHLRNIGSGDGVAVAVGAGNSSTGTQRVVIADDQNPVASNIAEVDGSAVTVGVGSTTANTPRVHVSNPESAPIFVAEAERTNADDYNEALAVAKDATNTWNRTITETNGIYLKSVWASASGRQKIVVKVGPIASEVVVWVGWTQSSNLNADHSWPAGLLIPNGERIQILQTNKDSNAMDLHAGYHAYEAD